jgi:phospholipase C
VTFDEWGGFYDHVPPPQVIDDTNPANVMHNGDSTTPTDGQLYPNYRQLGFRVPGLVVTNLAWPHRVVHEGPFEHCSSLALIESTFGLAPLTARDKYALNLRRLLSPFPVPPRFAVPPTAIPTSSDVIGPAISPPSESLIAVLEGTAEFDPAAICSADSVQSVSPAPVNWPPRPQKSGSIPGLTGTSGLADLQRSYRAGSSEPG